MSVEKHRTHSSNEVESASFDDHCDRQGSSFGAYFNVVCVIAGTGTLQLPSALNQGGWISVGIIVLSALIAIYTGNLLIKCLYALPGKRLHGYADVGQAAFGLPGKICVQIFHNCILLGASCIYIMLTGLNCHSLAEANGIDLSLKVWIIIAAALIWIPFASLKSLKEVAILSIFGALSTAVVVVVTMVLSGIEIASPAHSGPNGPVHSFVNASNLPIALASISFSFGGNVVYPHVESSMKHPGSWNRVLTAAIITICVLYLAISIPAYWAFGDKTVSPILNNLAPGPATTGAIVLITLHVILAAPILMTSFSLEMEHSLNLESRFPRAQFIPRFILRTIITVLLALIAMFIPYFQDFMSLIGALANCLIVFVLPIVCYLKLFGLRSVHKIELLWCAIVIIIGMIGCVLGAKDAIEALIVDFQTGGTGIKATH
ncbi:MAG: transmembrane amino acid transporter protein-domain-containing protein [Piptocephalis tieghemiana]|nr:MAG: transmembrane amino acid transporter protein-domain-containing protein [Piptocephalis tieghemiana]